MKYFLSILLILNINLAHSKKTIGNYSDFDFNRQDHQKHVLLSSALTIGSSLILENKFKMSPVESFILSSVFVLSLGYAKERLHDDYIDNSDLGANLVGTCLGGVVYFSF